MKISIAHFRAKIIDIVVSKRITRKPFHGTDYYLYYQQSENYHFWFRSKIKYESNVQNEIKKYIKKGDLVFDIGANIGQYLLPFSAWVGKEGKVVCVEPDKKSFNLLELNRLKNNITQSFLLNYGLSDVKETLPFYRDTIVGGGGRMGSFLKMHATERFLGIQEKVEVITLNDLVKVYGIPQVIKIDAEGFEFFILKSFEFFSEKTIFLVEVRESTYADVIKLFHTHNYSCYWIEKQKNINDIENISPFHFANLLFLSKEGGGFK